MWVTAVFAQGPPIGGDLKAANIDEPRVVPVTAETTIITAPTGPRATPAAVKLHGLLQPLCTPADNGRLSFRPGPDKPATILVPSKAHVVAVPNATSSQKVMLYCKGEQWYACSASTLRCQAKKEVVEFLDADLDGDFFGAADFLRHNENAFRPVDEARLLVMNDQLGRYEINATTKQPHLTIRPVPWPKWSTNEQRFGVVVIAECRQMGGLPPIELDETRSRICSLHANYLFQNKYSFATSIQKTHAEDADLPGYTKEGADAAAKVVMTFSGDMMEAVTAQLFAMLHRTAFLGPAQPGVGIALKLGSQVDGVPGYTVFWGNRPEGEGAGCPLLFPAPGGRGAATFCAREAPGVEDDPNYYDTQRGLAVSVAYGNLSLSKIKFSLFAEDKKKLVPVAGRVFSHEKPINRTTHPDNGRTAFFVADKMLATLTWHTAVFEAEVEGSTEPLRLQWSFETQK